MNELSRHTHNSDSRLDQRDIDTDRQPGMGPQPMALPTCANIAASHPRPHAMGIRTHLVRVCAHGLIAVALLCGAEVAHAYTNPAAHVVGATPAAVYANAPGIIASNLSSWSAVQVNTLQAQDLVVLYAASPASLSSIQYKSTSAYNLMVSSINASRSAGTLTYSNAKNHYLTRENAPSLSQQDYDVFNTLYAEVLTHPSMRTLTPAVRQREALAQVIIIITTSVSEAGGAAVLGAVGTGWWLGHDVIGPLASWGIQTYAPGWWNSIGENVASIVDQMSAEFALSQDTIIAISQFEMGLAVDMQVPILGNPDGSMGAWGDMDALDQAGSNAGCNPTNGCN